MEEILIIGNTREFLEALQRHLKYIFRIENVFIGRLNDYYGRRYLIEAATKSDLLVVEGFSKNSPVGFQLAKSMEKKALLLFYSWELNVDSEGPFWLVLPDKLCLLSEKISAIMDNPQPGKNEYQNLEEQFPELQEQKEDHR